jgi:hypothetical protein
MTNSELEWKHLLKSIDLDQVILNYDGGSPEVDAFLETLRNPFDPKLRYTSAERAVNGMYNGELHGLVEYLKEEKDGKFDPELRSALLGFLEGEESLFPRRLILTKHPAATTKFVPDDKLDELLDRFLILIQGYHCAQGFKRGWQQRGFHQAQVRLEERTGVKISLKRIQQILSADVLAAWKPISDRFGNMPIDFMKFGYRLENNNWFPDDLG